jgi:glutathione S-transferase
MNTRPILWHIEISHYNEKARWALDLKGVEHERRALVPGHHMAVALALTRGRCYTSPILELDGRRIVDSTAIIRALEERYPQPPLYPAEPVERRRALELEDFFDEQLGPYIRRLVFHELRSDRAGAARLAAQVAPRPMKRFPRMFAEYFLAGTALRYGAGSAKAAERARRRVLRVLDRLEAELGATDYLVGERFTVADLTAASLLYPLVLPAEGPALPEPPATFASFRESLKRRRGFRWVEEMFRRHRRHAPSAVAGDMSPAERRGSGPTIGSKIV